MPIGIDERQQDTPPREPAVGKGLLQLIRHGGVLPFRGSGISVPSGHRGNVAQGPIEPAIGDLTLDAEIERRGLRRLLPDRSLEKSPELAERGTYRIGLRSCPGCYGDVLGCRSAQVDGVEVIQCPHIARCRQLITGENAPSKIIRAREEHAKRQCRRQGIDQHRIGRLHIPEAFGLAEVLRGEALSQERLNGHGNPDKRGQKLGAALGGRGKPALGRFRKVNLRTHSLDRARPVRSLHRRLQFPARSGGHRTARRDRNRYEPMRIPQCEDSFDPL